jgi:2-keto-4-pentenoate hydratase
MAANIFATDIEDWVALTRAMRETGEQFRQGKIVLPQLADATAPARADAVHVDVSPAGAVPAGHK